MARPDRPAPKTRTIRQSVRLPAPPKVVYAALAEAKRHTEFTGSPAQIPRFVGGPMTAYDGYIQGKVLGMWPGRGWLQTWRTTEWPKETPDSRLEIRLEPDGKGTRLTMFHSDVPAAQADRYASGWVAFYWKPLRRYLMSTRPIMRSRRPGNMAAKPARRRAGR